MDWYWGWGVNPLLDSLENAAERGVAIRLVINQHYVNENPGIRQAVNELNDWEGDVEAILMSENETVTKLHNKGVIIDGESVLISSINWGDNSILRNREMGLILHSQQVTLPYMDSFWEDWNRLDETTDTDIDGIPDFWEVANNLSRTNQDSAIDSDGDGITNLGEYSYNSDPNSNDTDGDCIADGDEILWAATMANVSAGDALSLEDADGDGVDDYTVIGCVPDIDEEQINQNNSQGNNTENNTVVDDFDSDNDGVLDDLDECPGTEEGAAIDTQGCSNEQNKNQVFKDTDEEGLSSGMKFMWTLIIVGIIVLVSAGAILLRQKKEEDLDSETSLIVETTEAKSWEMPVLDGTSAEETSGIDMSKFQGWSAEQVQKYLDSGWSEDQLAEWYQQQVDNNNT
jgi:hypothetical protein